ncbi:MAG: acetylxylan esterase [Bryobacterales bacterium]|nr:acetylxylan esterase [Bryobacterales bacterium]
MDLKLAALLFLPVALAAQTELDRSYQRMLDSRRQVMAYLERQADEITRQATDEIASPEKWERARPRRLEELRDMLGLLPWPERTPLNLQVTGVLDKGDYTVEKIAFESLPRVYVTANLYVPKKRAGRAPAIIYVCGHAVKPYGSKTHYQRHGISFARNGYVAMILDPIQIAETFALHHGVYNQEMEDWYARGYTPAGVEVWNAMRAIDYLETRTEVDASKIGITGRSGGAAMSWFTAAVDPRVKVASPVMGISTYAANVRDNTQRLHCDCMFPINTYLHDMLHQGALIAPRALRMMHGRQDRLFPIPGYEEFERRVGTLFQGYGKTGGFDNIVVDTGHQDSHYLREQAIRWFDRHLMGIPERRLDMDFSEAPELELAVFGGNPPSDARNFRVHEFFTTAGPPRRHASPAAWNARQSALLETLRAKVFRALPEREAAPKAVTRRQIAGFEEIEFESEPGIPIRALVSKPKELPGPAPAFLYVASDGEDEESLASLLGTVPGVRMVVFPRGVGAIPWDRRFYRDALRNAMHTGRTVDSMRVHDVLSAFDVLRGWPGVDGARILVSGKKVSGGLALYAALLEPRIHQVLLFHAPTTHVEGPNFLNVLRYTDLPEAAAALAPRRLSFYGYIPDAYAYTRQVYELLGKGDHVFLTMSHGSVLEGRYDHQFSSGR